MIDTCPYCHKPSAFPLLSTAQIGVGVKSLKTFWTKCNERAPSPTNINRNFTHLPCPVSDRLNQGLISVPWKVVWLVELILRTRRLPVIKNKCVKQVSAYFCLFNIQLFGHNLTCLIVNIILWLLTLFFSIFISLFGSKGDQTSEILLVWQSCRVIVHNGNVKQRNIKMQY